MGLPVEEALGSNPGIIRENRDSQNLKVLKSVTFGMGFALGSFRCSWEKDGKIG